MSNHEDSNDRPRPYIPVDPTEIDTYDRLRADAERILAEALEVVAILQRRDAETDRWHPTRSDAERDALMQAIGSRAAWDVINRFDEVTRPDEPESDDSDD